MHAPVNSLQEWVRLYRQPSPRRYFPDYRQIFRRNIAGFDSGQAVALVDGAPMIGIPSRQMRGPSRAVDGDQPIVIALGPSDDVPGWDAEGWKLAPRGSG